MSYQYWNQFIEEWRSNPIHPTTPTIGGWTNPVDLYNVSHDPSLNYLPEPWWGNNGEDDLQSIVINYNPGRAGIHQSFNTIHSVFNNYSDFMAMLHRDYLSATQSFPAFNTSHSFHYTKRALVIYNALSACSAIAALPNPNDFYKHHLSLELIPWHTSDAKDSVLDYIRININQIFEYVFCFAADRSRHIINNKLHRKVLIRCSAYQIIKILDEVGYAYTIIVNKTEYPIDSNGYYFKFKFNDPRLNDVEFICIWGSNSHNEFPQPYIRVFHPIIDIL